jgi:LuxR family glucitol operon transcriptional activator
MQNNPGFIKWFVSVIQVGKRPEDVLQNPGLFLEFCLSNVYEYLDEFSRRVVRVMQAVPRALSMAEIAYISNIDPIRLQKAIHDLLTTNMLKMQSLGEGLGTESSFSLGDLAREFLDRMHAVSVKDYSTYKKRDAELQRSREIFVQEGLREQYSKYQIHTRNQSDYVVARYLLDSLAQSDLGNFDQALKIVSNAKDLSPSYFEVYRVEAWIYVSMRNIPAAKRSYEAALELEEGSAELHFWYAGFLARHEREYLDAIAHYKKAVSIKPGWIQAKLEIARTRSYLGDFDAANRILIECSEVRSGISSRAKRIFWDLFLKMPGLEAEHRMRSHDFSGVLDLAGVLLERLDGAPREVLDNKIVANILKLFNLAKKARFQFQDAEEVDRGDAILDRLRTELEFLGFDRSDVVDAPVLSGSVARLTGPTYGYIREFNSGTEYFGSSLN